MNWLWAIILGLILGVLARAVLPGRQRIGIILTAIFGILGALLGNAAAGWLNVADTSGVDWTRHLLQLAGAVLVVGVGASLWAAIRGDKAGHGHQRQHARQS